MHFWRRARREQRLAVIETLSPIPPDRVLRDSPQASQRQLVITGRNFPLANHGLQFQNVATGDLSIILDMEVSWESDTRITLDMASIADHLWPDDELTLRVRVFDTKNANYRPISEWSRPFLLVAATREIGDPATGEPRQPVDGHVMQTWPELLAELDALGFYDYADADWIDRAKAETLKTGLLSSRAFDDLTGRVFSADAESLAEGGVVAFLERISPILERQGIRLDASQEWGVDRTDYPVTLNGKTHLIYSEHDLGRTGTWTAALVRTLVLVNALLAEAGSSERVYGLQDGFGGEASRAIFLTPALYRLTSTSPLIAEAERPLLIEDMLAWLD